MIRDTFSFWKRLTTEQKFSVSLFVVFGLVALILSIVQVRRSLIYPFTSSVDDLVAVQNMFGPTDEELEEEARRTDDDGDGISNWNEEQVFHTSPYLADTDSDGIADNTEIARGSDPNCPEGEDCAYSLTTNASASDGFSGVSQGIGGGSGVMPLVPERSPEAIRTFLRAQGVSDADIANYSDEMLLEAYDQSSAVFDEASANTTGTDAIMEESDSSVSETPSDL